MSPLPSAVVRTATSRYPLTYTDLAKATAGKSTTTNSRTTTDRMTFPHLPSLAINWMILDYNPPPLSTRSKAQWRGEVTHLLIPVWSEESPSMHSLAHQWGTKSGVSAQPYDRRECIRILAPSVR